MKALPVAILASLLIGAAPVSHDTLARCEAELRKCYRICTKEAMPSWCDKLCNSSSCADPVGPERSYSEFLRWRKGIWL